MLSIMNSLDREKKKWRYPKNKYFNQAINSTYMQTIPTASVILLLLRPSQDQYQYIGDYFVK